MSYRSTGLFISALLLGVMYLTAPAFCEEEKPEDTPSQTQDDPPRVVSHQTGSGGERRQGHGGRRARRSGSGGHPALRKPNKT